MLVTQFGMNFGEATQHFVSVVYNDSVAVEYF